MKITNVEAFWLRCPIPKEKQHFSDYGLLTNFDMTLVVVTTEDARLPVSRSCLAAVREAGLLPA